jgi:hypothetical protein
MCWGTLAPLSSRGRSGARTAAAAAAAAAAMMARGWQRGLTRRSGAARGGQVGGQEGRCAGCGRGGAGSVMGRSKGLGAAVCCRGVDGRSYCQRCICGAAAHCLAISGSHTAYWGRALLGHQ